MQATSRDARGFLLQRISTDRGRVDGAAKRLRQLEGRLMGAVLGTTALATLLAGWTTAAGPLMGSGTPAWRWTCGIVAVLTTLTGLFSGAYQRFQIGERRAQALACSGRLRALEVALGITDREVTEVAQDYEALVIQYPEFVG